MLARLKSTLKSIGYFIWSLFFKGFLTLLPIILTGAVLTFSFKVLKKWLHPIYNLEPDFLKAIPFSEFLLTFFFILFVGLILNIFFLNSLWATFETILGKIPLIRPIYAGIKQLVHAFNPHDKESFKHVVLTEFPRQGVYSIGFMTGETPTELSGHQTTVYYNVFIPTTPNPTAGFFLIIPKEQVIITTLSRQEAMALIISGGIIQPERLTNQTKT
jgi:uncharacterized membrane protein